MSTDSTDSQTIDTLIRIDGLGRPIYTAKSGFITTLTDPQGNITETASDPRGRITGIQAARSEGSIEPNAPDGRPPRRSPPGLPAHRLPVPPPRRRPHPRGNQHPADSPGFGSGD